eukprot:8315569-Pyramimonas_sp.AAC.2
MSDVRCQILGSSGHTVGRGRRSSNVSPRRRRAPFRGAGGIELWHAMSSGGVARFWMDRFLS